MRVAVLGPLPPVRGGIAAHTVGAIDALEAAGHEVQTTSYRRLYPRWAAGVRPGSGLRSPSLIDDEVIDCFAPRTWLRAAARIRAFEPDLVLVQYWTPIAAPAIGSVLSRVGAATRIVVCHNAQPHEAIPGAILLTKWVLGRCDGVVFHSRHVGEQARGSGDDRPSAVAQVPLLSGVCVDQLRPPVELVTASASGARMFVCPGHLRTYKGLGVLASAWRRAALPDDALLVVAGEPLAVGREIQALRDLGPRVRVISRYLDDGELAWLLAHAAAVVLPYIEASQSGLLPLALRLARQIIVSNAGGLTEALSRTDTLSLPVTVVTAGDVDLLAAAIRQAADCHAAVNLPGRGGALRYAEDSITAEERRESWASFISALERLMCSSGSSRPSNSAPPPSSDPYVDSGREPSASAWYYARRSGLPRRE